MILLDPKKITQFIVDATNICDKEYLADVTKVLITGKTILTESELGTVQNSTWIDSVEKFRIPYFMYVYYTKVIMHIYKKT